MNLQVIFINDFNRPVVAKTKPPYFPWRSRRSLNWVYKLSIVKLEDAPPK